MGMGGDGEVPLNSEKADPFITNFPLSSPAEFVFTGSLADRFPKKRVVFLLHQPRSVLR